MKISTKCSRVSLAISANGTLGLCLNLRLKWQKHTHHSHQTSFLIACLMLKSGMDGHIEQKVSGHINQHQLKFITCNGEVVTFYKKWSTSPKWLPCSPPDETYGLTLVHSLPTGIPEIITPNCDKIPLPNSSKILVNFPPNLTKSRKFGGKNF